MKKALLGRRLFASLMPAAPVMAGEIGRGVADKLVTGNSSYIGDTVHYGDGRNVPRPRIDPPATYEKYREAENALSKVREFRYQRNRIMLERHIMDPNIMALKSVAPQHKAMMHLTQQEREYEQNRTFLEQLQDALGLREYFKKRVDLKGPESATGGW